VKNRTHQKIKKIILFFLFGSLFLPKVNFGQSQNDNDLSTLYDTVSIDGKLRAMHFGWKDGRIAETSNAYTLYPYEFRLNLLGRSSLGLSEKVEFSTYLPLIICPNFTIKDKFIDYKHFSSALEVGAAGGLFPLGIATGILLPGVVVGGGSIGLLHGSDLHAKLFLTCHPTDKLTFSVRGGASRIHVGYWGLVGFAGLGGDGIVGGLLPVSPNQSFAFYSGGFETDYVWNQKNAIVFNANLGVFEGAKKELGMATLCWTHSKIHFHYSLGLYGFYDPPSFEMVKKSKLPVSYYANVYWIFNNGKTLYLPKQN